MASQTKRTPTKIEPFILQLLKIGGEVKIKTLRRSKKDIHPRKFLVILKIPFAVNKEILEQDEQIKLLKEKSLYDGCIVEVEKTSEKFSTISFGYIVNNKNMVIPFINKLSKISRSLKKDLEEKYKNNQ